MASTTRPIASMLPLLLPVPPFRLLARISLEEMSPQFRQRCWNLSRSTSHGWALVLFGVYSVTDSPPQRSQIIGPPFVRASQPGQLARYTVRPLDYAASASTPYFVSVLTSHRSAVSADCHSPAPYVISFKNISPCLSFGVSPGMP